jgi:Arc/MetJ-type ribon-helix-helix transcriptional regulator
MAAQLVTRIDDDLAAALDQLVASGLIETRSDGVRRALVEMIDRVRREEIGRQIADGYQRIPQTDDDVGWSDAATVAMIEAEPW